ncbi:MAG: amidohydrolase family protein, partial [Candidatus Eremiobacteraeota bacterium]|nr:amidohydrolase family protein [Candidatus Eremiobacteraeota bacterium]
MKHFCNARVYAFEPRTRTYHRHTGFLVDGATLRTFEERQIGSGIEVCDLQGCTVVPAFADCHVHLTDTGYVTGKRNLGAVRSAAEFCDAVLSLPTDEFLLAGNYDDTEWPDGLATAAILNRTFADSYAMLVRIDGHSSLVNRKTLEWLRLEPATEGLERGADGTPTGRLLLDANWRAQMKFLAAIPLEQRRAAERAATAQALEQGALHLHVQLVGFEDAAAYACEIEALAALPPARWYPKICEPNPELAHSLGLPFIGGDVFLDGSIGSATAAVSEPYVTTPTSEAALRCGR